MERKNERRSYGNGTINKRKMKFQLVYILLILLSFSSCNENIREKENLISFENNKNSQALDTTKIPIFNEPNLMFHKDSLYPTSAFFDGGSKYEEYINDKGIPIHTIGDKKYFHPSQVAAYGLDLYFDFYKTGDSLTLQKFLKQAKWLSNNLKQKGDFSIWEIPFDNHSFIIDAPYPSALTNSWGAGVLLLASQFENKELYFKQSKSAINYILTDINNGGGLAYLNDEIWFEEYPSIDNLSHVLNGYIFSIDILHLFYEVTNEKNYYEYLQKAFNSLDKNLINFDKDYGSIYDQFLKGNKIGNGYHKLHWIQLLWAYKITGKRNFYLTAKHFLEQEKQNNYKLQSDNCIDCEKHGVPNLNNNIYWYNSWSARDKIINLNIEFDKVKKVYQLNFYSVSEKNFPDSIMICNDPENKCWSFNINKLKVVGSNKHKKNETFVKVLFLPDVLNKQKLKITFFNPSRKIIALRSLGIQFFDEHTLIYKYKKLNEKNFWDNRHTLQNKTLNYK